MARFSSRFKFNPLLPDDPVVEDAPEGMRIVYINSVLQPLTCERRWDGENQENRPFESFLLKQEFCILARQEIPPFPRSTTEWEDLKTLLRGAAWFHFYDFIEVIGKSLRSKEQTFEGLPEHFGFAKYRKNVNELFGEDRIGWRLNDKAELEKQISPALSKRLAAIEGTLVDRFEPARKHYLKAIQYTLSTQPDPENAIKEVTSAIESVGRVLYPKANTLGKVVKEMEKGGAWPLMLVAMIEKYYAYASSEPAVRHGGPAHSRVLLRDAEFCLHVGAAIIRYLVDSRTSQPEAPLSLG